MRALTGRCRLNVSIGYIYVIMFHRASHERRCIDSGETVERSGFTKAELIHGSFTSFSEIKRSL